MNLSKITAIAILSIFCAAVFAMFLWVVSQAVHMLMSDASSLFAGALIAVLSMLLYAGAGKLIGWSLKKVGK